MLSEKFFNYFHILDYINYNLNFGDNWELFFNRFNQNSVIIDQIGAKIYNIDNIVDYLQIILNNILIIND